jgi:hypothetical protein
MTLITDLIYKKREQGRDFEITQREWVTTVVLAFPDRTLQSLIGEARTGMLTIGNTGYFAVIHQMVQKPFLLRRSCRNNVVTI